MKELTDRQSQVFQYIVKYRQERSIPPSYREVARHFGISYYAARCTIELIRKKGILTRDANKARSLLAL
jgi:repressor LexA